MKYTAEFDSNIAAQAKKDADAVRALRSEMEAASAAITKASRAGPSVGQQAVADRSPWAGPLRVNQAVPEIYRATGALKKEQEARAAKEKTEAAAAKAAERRRAAGAAGGAAGAGVKMAAGAAAAAAGALGVASLAQLAMGYHGMARLNMLTARTSLQLRQMFLGVDSGPAVRAADRFLTSIFGKGQVAATGLQGLFTRSFNSIFGAMERGQPIATALFQGIVRGGLQVENTYLRARLGIAPFVDAIEGAIGPVDAAGSSAEIASVAVWGLAAAGAAVAAPYAAAAGAITLAIDQWRKLKAEWGSWKEGASLVGKQLRRDLGFTSAADEAADIDTRTRAGFSNTGEQQAAAKARADWNLANGLAGAAGTETGEAYAAGMVKGAAAGAGAVNAAGQGLVTAMDAGVRAKGEIKSPSRLAKRTAANFPAGTVEGIKSGKGQVQAAAESAMVPDLGGGGSAGVAAPAAAGMRIEIVQHNTFGGGSRGDIEASLEAANAKLIRDLAVQLGIPVTVS